MVSYSKVLFAIVGFLVVFMQAIYGQEDTVNLQLRWQHQFQFAGYYAAQQKGFYEDEKLHVKIAEYKSGRSAVEEVLADRAQYGVAGSDILLSYMKGKPVKVLASIFQHSPYVIVSIKGRGVFKPTDLSKKKIMTAEMGSIVLYTLLQNEGIPKDSVKLVPFNAEEFLRDTSINAIVTYKSVVPFDYTKKGYETMKIEPSDYGVDFYGDVLFTSEDETKNNPERVEKFKRASLKGWEYALAHPDEIINYILTLPGVKERGVDKQMLKTEFMALEDIIRPNLVEIGHMNKGRWEFIFKRFSQLNIRSVHKNIDQLLYSPQDHTKVYEKILIYIIVFLLVCALFFFMRSVFVTHNLNQEKRKLLEIDSKSRFNEESIRLILKNAGIILWDWDLVSNSISVLGLNNSENAYHSISDFKEALHPDDLSKFNTFMSLLPESFTEEVQIKINGVYQWRLLTIKARKFSADNLPIIYTGMFINISEIKQKEAHLDKLSRELEFTNSELEKFAYITSHNIRAPIVNLESLMDFYDFECKDQNANNDIMNKIHISIQRLKNTLEELVKVTSKK